MNEVFSICALPAINNLDSRMIDRVRYRWRDLLREEKLKQKKTKNKTKQKTTTRNKTNKTSGI